MLIKFICKGIKDMERRVGTISRGIRCPIIREGDNLPEIVVDCVLKASESANLKFKIKTLLPLQKQLLPELKVTMQM